MRYLLLWLLGIPIPLLNSGLAAVRDLSATQGNGACHDFMLSFPTSRQGFAANRWIRNFQP